MSPSVTIAGGITRSTSARVTGDMISSAWAISAWFANVVVPSRTTVATVADEPPPDDPQPDAARTRAITAGAPTRRQRFPLVIRRDHIGGGGQDTRTNPPPPPRSLPGGRATYSRARTGEERPSPPPRT